MDILKRPLLQKVPVSDPEGFAAKLKKIAQRIAALLARGVPTTPEILLQKHRDTNGSPIVIQIGVVYATY